MADAPPPAPRWVNEPRRWSWEQDGRLLVEADPGTDFWQGTHYGFRVDSGHLLGSPVDGDFTLAATVLARPRAQYDQAGLMVRFSPTCWLKTSAEFEPGGASRLGVVVTNDGWSDWSTQDVAASPAAVRLRVQRRGDDCVVEASVDDAGPLSQIRVAHLRPGPTAPPPVCGVYACCPRGDGFTARFDGWTLVVA